MQAVPSSLASSPGAVTAALCALVWLNLELCKRTPAGKLGPALMVIILGALASNLGLIPTGSGDESSSVYSAVFSWVAPLSIFWLLLPVNLRSILSAGAPMIFAFLVGMLGTTLGVMAGMAIIGGPDLLGADYAAASGMYAGTYTGGSVNFNAVALHYNVVERGGLYAAMVAADNIVTALWMVACLVLPRALGSIWPSEVRGGAPPESESESETTQEDLDMDAPEATNAGHLALLIGFGLAVVVASGQLSAWAGEAGLQVPSIVLVSVFALIAAQVPALAQLPGARVLAMLSVYLFLGVIGAYCDVGALGEVGELGPKLLVLAFTTVAVHGALTFAAARLARVDLKVAAVASQANIGGATTALALARSLNRSDLVLPAILMGSLGTALGTFLGFWLAGALGG